MLNPEEKVLFPFQDFLKCKTKFFSGNVFSVYNLFSQFQFFQQLTQFFTFFFQINLEKRVFGFEIECETKTICNWTSERIFWYWKSKLCCKFEIGFGFNFSYGESSLDR